MGRSRQRDVRCRRGNRRALRERRLDDRCEDPAPYIRRHRCRHRAGRGTAQRDDRRSDPGFRGRRRCRGRRCQLLVHQLHLGCRDHREDGPRTRDLPGGRRALHLDPLRVADGGRRTGRNGTRPARDRRGVLGVPVRGDPCDGDRLPHDPRLLAVRHDRRVRPRQGERGQVRGRQDALRGHRQHLDEPGADAVDQHEYLVDPARHLAVAHRRRAPRGVDPARVRARAPGRHDLGRLLVDLRRRAAARVAQGGNRSTRVTA